MESKLHSIFRYQNFREIPRSCSPDLFLVPNDERQTCLHIAATCNGFDHIPKELLTAENLLQQDGSGDTPIHLAAFVGRLQMLPLEALPRDVFYAHDGNGKSVITIAREKRILWQIPVSILLADETYQYEAILSNLSANRIRNIDQRLMDPAIWSRTPPGRVGGSTLYHIASEFGLLDQLPAKMLLSGVLKSKNRCGETPLHMVAKCLESGSLERVYSRIPEAFDWTDKDLLGNTLLHCAARSGQLASVPVSILTEQAVTTRNHSGKMVLDLAFESNCLTVVPLELQFLCDDYARIKLNNALVSGDCSHIPASLLSFASLERLLPHGSGHGSALHIAACHGTLHLLPSEAFSEEILERLGDMGISPLHVAAATGKLDNLPPELLTYEQLTRPDKNGRTPCHVGVSAGHLGKLPSNVISQNLMLIPDNDGVTCFHLGAAQARLGGIPISLFNREALLAANKAGQSVADIIEEHGNTPLLPPYLRNFSRSRALVRLREGFSRDFVSASALYARELAELIALEEFQLQRRNFVLEWSEHYPVLVLDEEQADAVAEIGPHVQVTARAGSGKTRTLVARALFMITHCRTPASSILILAFNKKAVEEIRVRLSEHLSDEQMPHVLTFHALAYRIVKPAEGLIFDEGETKEGQVFSTTIQRVIDEGMRGGPHEAEFRAVMEGRWEADLKRIIRLGFNLPQEEFLDLRASLQETTMNGRRVNSEAHKHIGNALLRLGIGYSYRRGIHRASGVAYEPDFSHYHKETNQRLVIEVLGEDALQANAARQAFWNSDRSANAHLLQLTDADCQDPGATLERVARELAVRGIDVSPMSADELWLALRDDVIRDFTKAVKNFISRCQKELIEPEQLAGIIEAQSNTAAEVQVQFWHLCGKIYARYRQVLIEQRLTDFDQLMLNAAGMIREGNTGFKSARGSGDIRQVRHLLIDEYQDFSHLFDELRKSIIDQSPDANFFCVGDDWQAINKFAGSDLRYFTGFRETFEPSVRKLITRNYRSCRKIVEIGNRVMQGEGEPSVPNSNEQGNTWRVEVGAYGNLSEAEEVVIEELGDDALSILRIASDCTCRGESVAVLSRTSSVATPEGMNKLERWQERLRSFLPEKQRGLLEVSTTHGYKGKEADAVILLDPEAYPFVHPDAIFSTIFGDTFKSIQDDEKRLFYVGVTRPKKALFLLSYPSRYSEQRAYRIRFLANAYPPPFDINRLQSNLLCGSRVVVRLTNQPGTYGNGGTFPIKDQLKALEFKWNEDRKIWSIFLERGSIRSPFDCVQYLNAQPWIKNADAIVASFAWEDQKHCMKIVGGKVILDTVPGKVMPDTVQDELEEADRYAGEQRHSEPDYDVEEYLLATHSQPHFMQDEGPPKLVAVSTEAFDTTVAGMRYEGRMRKASHLSVGDFVRLEREPGNRHDRNAIKVVTAEGVHIGYLSRHVAGCLAKALDTMGGSHEAEVSSVWKQPFPHFLVSIQICFRLPVGIRIPADLGRSYFVKPGPDAPPITETAPPTAAVSQPPATTPPPAAPQTFSGSLTPAQEGELADLCEPLLRSIITELYLTGSCPWPVIGYEGQDAKGRCTDSMLEAAWPDHKIGIYLPTNNVSSFAVNGWVILPAAAVSVEMLRSILSSATGHAAVPQTPASSASPSKTPPNQSTMETIHDDDLPF